MVQVCFRILTMIMIFFVMTIYFTENLAYGAVKNKPLSTQQKKPHQTKQKKIKSMAQSPHQTNKKYAKKKVKKSNRGMTSASSSNMVLADDSSSFVGTIKKRLVGFVHEVVGTLRYSSYKLGGTRFDTSRGVYILDCSSYVDHILKSIYPKAYGYLVNSTKTEKPTTHDYYHFFNNLSDSSSYYWNKIDAVWQLEPGDIIVFRYKNTLGNETGGHVMVVMDKPIATDNPNVFYVRITDSASGGHSRDTRRLKSSGIGIGTLVLKVNPKTYQPAAFAWRVGSKWKENVSVVMGRPSDTMISV